MLTAVATVLLTFLLTGIVGSRLVHKWQYHNWLQQQNLLRTERELNTLEALFDEVALLAGKRQYQMTRLLRSLQRHDEKIIQARLEAYDEATIAWNERINALYAKLTIQLSWSYTRNLEEIQKKFVSLGQRLEALAREAMEGSQIPLQEIKRTGNSLNSLQGEIGNFHKAILRFIQERKSSIYEKIELTEATLDTLPTWELFVALFKPWVQRQEII
jgi:hypothetical protein